MKTPRISAWLAAFVASEAALVAVWGPALAFDPPVKGAHQDVASIVILTLLLLGPPAVASGLLAGRTDDPRHRFAWLMGFALVAAIATVLLSSFAGDAFACQGAAGPTRCGSTLAERITGVLAAQGAIFGQWAVARREWFYRPGKRER